MSIITLQASDIPFKIGETLKYKASFSSIPAGSAILKVIKKEIINDINTFHIRFKAQTEGFTDLIFPIDDVINIWLEENSLLPIKIEEIINEGKYSRKKLYIIYQSQGYGIINNEDTLKFEEEVHSPYSLLYFFRKTNFKTFNKKKINILKKKSFETLSVDIKSNLEVNSEFGTWLSTCVEPKRVKRNKFKNDSAISIWFAEDSKKYPIKFWIKMKYGGLLLELYEFE